MLPFLMDSFMKLKEFILDYVEKNSQVDTLNSEFIDAVNENFPKLKLIVYMLGANKIPRVNKILTEMYNEGSLDRYRISICGLGPGFPKWVYVYIKPGI